MENFLFDAFLKNKIKEIISRKNSCIASAFLGFGSEKNIPDSSRVICDIGMGGTNANSLIEIRKKLGNDLRWMSAFHPKVYLSDVGCIICSANLSNNGVGFLGQNGLIEVGVFHEYGSSVYTQAKDWFDKCFHQALPVSDVEIDIACRTWSADRKGMPDSDGTLKGWNVILTYEEIDEKLKDDANIFLENNHSKYSIDINNVDFFQDLPESRILSGYYINVHVGSRGKIYITPLRFLFSKNFETTDGKSIISYFEALKWKGLLLKKPDAKILSKNSSVREMIIDKEDEWSEAIITLEDFVKVIGNIFS